MRNLLPTATLALAAALLSPGCRSTSTSYQFSPSPLEVLVTQSEDEPILARVLVGIPGAEREGGRRSGIPELLVRLRLENQSGGAIRFDPATSTLLGSDLAQFGPAKSQPPGVLVVPAGGTQSVLVRYPFPQDGSLDAPLLTGVNLRFELVLDDGREAREAVEVSATLDRVDQTQRYNARNSVIWGTGWRGGWGPGFGNNWGFGYASNYYGCW